VTTRWEGEVHEIYVAPEATGPMRSLRETRAVEGRGLEGDRYFDGVGTFSNKPGTGRQITLIEQEALSAASGEARLAPGESRRNIVTVGVPLNHLVGKRFRVGEAVLVGTRLCEPCAHLAKLTGMDVMKAFAHRGGLRAEVVEGGAITVGARVTPL
jgi:MOSC domain-containing protein YiiM